MASWKSTSTYFDEVPLPGANIVSGMWIFRVKWPPGSPPVFKARYVARGFSQQQGVDFFQTFSPTPKMTTLRSTAASALVAELVDFAAHCRLDYATSLVAESASVCPPSVGGECALSMDVLEDRQEEFQCFATALPHLVAMDAEMASWKSTGTYVDEVPPPGANFVSGMWIFRVKRPPGSPPVFKARYVARGFSQRLGVDYFQTFSPTLKMTTLRVLLHVAAQRDYELHSLDFSTTFLQGSLHEEIWLRRPSGFTGSFPPGTQWSLRRPVYGLRQAPREWHDTLRTTLAALGFAPSTADPSLFLRTNTTLPPFYVLVYVDDLVFATADTEALAHVKSELQKRHTCTDLEPLEVSSDTSGPAKGGYPAAEVAASFCRSPRLETPPGFLPWPPLLPLQPVGVDSDAAGGGDAGGAGSGAAGTGGAEAGGAGSGGAGSGGARAGGAGGAPDGGTRGSSAGGAGAGGTRAGAGQRQHLHPQATLLPLQLCEWVSQRGAKPGGAGSGGAEPRGTDSGSADTGGAEPCYNVVVVVVLRATKGPTEGSAKATLTGVRSGVRSVQSRKKYMDATESKRHLDWKQHTHQDWKHRSLLVQPGKVLDQVGETQLVQQCAGEVARASAV
ncbi:unnamed protein product [Closterium sp. NIES-54]